MPSVQGWAEAGTANENADIISIGNRDRMKIDVGHDLAP